MNKTLQHLCATFYLPNHQRILGLFPPLAMVNNAAMNVDIHISLQHPAFNSFESIPRTEIVRSHGNSIFNFMRSHYIVFHHSCNILHPCQQWTRAPIFPHPS